MTGLACSLLSAKGIVGHAAAPLRKSATGWVGSLHRRDPNDYYTIGNEVRVRTLAAAREKLGEAVFAGALAEGRVLSMDEAAAAVALVT